VCAVLTSHCHLCHSLGRVGPPPGLQLRTSAVEGQPPQSGLGVVDAELALGSVDRHATGQTVLDQREANETIVRSAFKGSDIFMSKGSLRGPLIRHGKAGPGLRPRQ